MMKYTLKAYSIQEYGQRKDAQGRPHQEDSIFPLYGQQTDNDRLFILCDGMGGHDAGEVASATVCEAMSQSVMASAPDSEALFTDDMLQKAVADAFQALDAKDNGAARKMGTTMTFLKLHAGGATIAHMGDSRVYHIRPGKDAATTQILFETEDHSLVNDLVKVGELTPEEARVSPQKNIITRAMQPHMDRKPKADIHHISDIQPGDYFYMCSDGMLEQMEDANIRFNFSDMNGDDANKVQVLTNATIDNRDNHTALIIHILDVEGEAERPAPAPSGAAVMTPPPATFTADAVDDDDEPTTPPVPPTQAGAPHGAAITTPQPGRAPQPQRLFEEPLTPDAPTRQPQRPASRKAPQRQGVGMEGKNKYLALIIVAALLGIAFAATWFFKGKDEGKTQCPDTELTTPQPGGHRHHTPKDDTSATTPQSHGAETQHAQGDTQEPAPQQAQPGKPGSAQPDKQNTDTPAQAGAANPGKTGAANPAKTGASHQAAAATGHNDRTSGADKIREEFGKRKPTAPNAAEGATDAAGKKQ